MGSDSETVKALPDWEEACRIHENLSPLAARFVEFARRRPEARYRSSYEPLRRDNPLSEYVLQPWPTLVDEGFLGQLTRATTTVSALLRDVPRRLFGNDPGRITEFYGIDPERARLACEILAEGDYSEAVIGRGDFIAGPSGVRCIEFNMSSALGGWQGGLWTDLYRRVPILEDFFHETGSRYRVTSPAARLFRHLIERSRGNPALDDGAFNVAFVGDSLSRAKEVLRHYATAELRTVLAELAPGHEGEAFICPCEDLEMRGEQVVLGDRRIHAVVNNGVFLTRPVFFAWMMGGVAVYNAVVEEILGDKRNLALLSQGAETGKLSEVETAAVRDHVPWTRLVEPVETSYRGVNAYLPDLVRSERGRFVLKPGTSWGGKSVHLGESCDQSEWDDRLDLALNRGSWIVQERVPSYRLLYQTGDEGVAWHDVIWGSFSFGTDGFDGGFVRVAPVGGGVVNVSQGAENGLIFEVEEGGSDAH